jgi:hypothetical protein
MSDNNLENPKDFVLAGKAIFTVQNEKTGNRFTFKVKQADCYTNLVSSEKQKVWFVSVLNGPDNGSNYAYIGTIFGNQMNSKYGDRVHDFRHTQKSTVTAEAQCFKVFDWMLKNNLTLPTFVKIHHEGFCGRCGRRLTVPASIKNGLGPECAKK